MTQALPRCVFCVLRRPGGGGLVTTLLAYTRTNVFVCVYPFFDFLSCPQLISQSVIRRACVQTSYPNSRNEGRVQRDPIKHVLSENLQNAPPLLHDQTFAHSPPAQVKWHPSRPYLFSGSLDRTVRVWDGRGGASLVVWTGHKDGVMGLTVSPDGTFIISCADDHRALVWELPAE